VLCAEHCPDAIFLFQLGPDWPSKVRKTTQTNKIQEIQDNLAKIQEFTGQGEKYRNLQETKDGWEDCYPFHLRGKPPTRAILENHECKFTHSWKTAIKPTCVCITVNSEVCCNEIY
jgi:hypothetical protein